MNDITEQKQREGISFKGRELATALRTQARKMLPEYDEAMGLKGKGTPSNNSSLHHLIALQTLQAEPRGPNSIQRILGSLHSKRAEDQARYLLSMRIEEPAITPEFLVRALHAAALEVRADAMAHEVQAAYYLNIAMNVEELGHASSEKFKQITVRIMLALFRKEDLQQICSKFNSWLGISGIENKTIEDAIKEIEHVLSHSISGDISWHIFHGNFSDDWEPQLVDLAVGRTNPRTECEGILREFIRDCAYFLENALKCSNQAYFEAHYQLFAAFSLAQSQNQDLFQVRLRLDSLLKRAQVPEDKIPQFILDVINTTNSSHLFRESLATISTRYPAEELEAILVDLVIGKREPVSQEEQDFKAIVLDRAGFFGPQYRDPAPIAPW